MKIKGLVVLAITITVMLSSCAKNAIQSAKMKSQSDSLSYAFGTVYYNALTADSLFLEPVMFAKADRKSVV